MKSDGREYMPDEKVVNGYFVKAPEAMPSAPTLTLNHSEGLC
jgi:hypothetical protein